jgi:hypothetical protein
VVFVAAVCAIKWEEMADSISMNAKLRLVFFIGFIVFVVFVPNKFNNKP